MQGVCQGCCVTKLSFPPLDDSICGTRASACTLDWPLGKGGPGSLVRWELRLSGGPHGTVLESPLDGIPWVQAGNSALIGWPPLRGILSELP